MQSSALRPHPDLEQIVKKKLSAIKEGEGDKLDYIALRK
jgi:hypothetical protein